MSFLNKITSFFRGKLSEPKQETNKVVAPKTWEKPVVKTQAPVKQQPAVRQVDPAVAAQSAKEAELLVKQYVNEAKAKAREIIIEAKDEAFKLKQTAQEEANRKHQEVDRLQQNLYKTQAEIDSKLGRIEEKDKFIEGVRQQIEKDRKEIEKIHVQQVEKLEQIASLTREEAKNLILEATKKKHRNEIGKIIKDIEEEAAKTAEDSAKNILVDAMYHGATDYVSEYTVSIVKIGDEDVKGRVIGREGRNIRTFEKITGVDVDLDEEGIIRLSCFDSVRREIARVTLETLIKDGRIQPARIEEIFEKTTQEIEKVIFKAGEDLCHRVKVYNLPKPIVQMLGRFKYRYSYGQNMITHCIEVVKIGVALATEVGANVNVVRLGCLLHDIGKVITEEEGSHVTTGVNFCKKNGIPQQVIDAIAQHHEDEPFSSKESILVYIADAISGARPGARYADLEGYVTRMQELEKAAKTFEGVRTAYAIQAGREVRIIVDPEAIDDNATYKLASDIRDKIKEELTYPGTVKVTVIRELRKTEVAN